MPQKNAAKISVFDFEFFVVVRYDLFGNTGPLQKAILKHRVLVSEHRDIALRQGPKRKPSKE
jgi:hypothetical protein